MIGDVSSDDVSHDDAITLGALDFGTNVIILQHDDDDDDVSDQQNDHLIFPSGDPKVDWGYGYFDELRMIFLYHDSDLRYYDMDMINIFWYFGDENDLWYFDDDNDVDVLKI